MAGTDIGVTSLPVIAVDGNAASGKGALARNLAKRLHFACLDSGVVYRLVALRMIENGCAEDDESAASEFARVLRRIFDVHHVTPSALKRDEVSQMSSRISAFPAVRSEVRELQREFIRNPPELPSGVTAKGTVLDGRDIGTVVWPEARVKFFVTAEAETRAFRRFRELQLKGFIETYEEVLREIRERDKRDFARITAPMKASPDALLLDTTTLSPSEVLDAALRHVEEKLGSSRA